MICSVCDNEATRRCPRCGKPYCEEHGGDLCAACQDPATAVPSGTVFRGSLVALLVASILALWLLIQPPGLSDDESGTAAVAPATVTPAVLATVSAPSPTATPAATETPTPEASPTPEGTPAETANATPSPTPTPTPEPTPEPSPFTEYEVQSGDTLSSIASSFGTTVQRLVEINGLESQDVIINVGQKLLVPTEPETP